MIRQLSHTEISTKDTCEARHAFRYTGHLTDGQALKRRVSVPQLRDGKAWGRGVAAWHELAGQMRIPGSLERSPLEVALVAIEESLDEDHAAQLAWVETVKNAGRRAELVDEFEREHLDAVTTMQAMVAHYASTTPPLILHDLEHRIEVAIPSRTGRRKSSRYRFVCYLDGLANDVHGRVWLVEFKLRDTLTDPAILELDRQTRWSAWAARERTGLDIAGVVIDERWKRIPHPPKLVQSKRKAIVRVRDDGRPDKDYVQVPSHDGDQLATLDAYRRLCADHGVAVSPETEAKLEAKQWHQRFPVKFRRGELDEAGLELVSEAQDIGQLDRGERYPVRNPSPRTCGGCAFLRICAMPETADLVSDFEARPPKRDRVTNEEEATANGS